MSDRSEIEVVYSSRGFKHFQPIADSYGGQVRVYESSAAGGPHVWLAIEQSEQIAPKPGEAHSHLTLEQAELLVAQLQHLLEHHYQLED